MPGGVERATSVPIATLDRHLEQPEPAEHHDTAIEIQLLAIVNDAPARCAIAAKHLGTGAVARVNAGEHLPLLSVVKLPVALVVLDSVDRGGGR